MKCHPKLNKSRAQKTRHRYGRRPIYSSLLHASYYKIINIISSNVEADGSLAIYTHGGSKLFDKSYQDWVNEVVDRGAGEILLTAMHKDGTGSGFDLELLKPFGPNFPVQVIASGGAKGPKDFLDAIQAGADAVLAAGIFHRGEYTVKQIKNYLINNNIKMRM